MKTSDLFVLPSHWEGLPNVILEAMSSGLPIVTTQVEGIDELLQNQVSAEIVPIGDIPALSASVARLVSDSGLRSRYSQTASQTVKQNFSWERCVEQYDQLYQSLLEPE